MVHRPFILKGNGGSSVLVHTSSVKTLHYIKLKLNFNDFPQIQNTSTLYGIYRVRENSIPKRCEVHTCSYRSQYTAGTAEIDVCTYKRQVAAA
jgi:hypothetical protein